MLINTRKELGYCIFNIPNNLFSRESTKQIVVILRRCIMFYAGLDPGKTLYLCT